MFWKAIALFGAGSFFFVGWGVLTDPLCNSVSFRGGGARTVLTTCFPDSRGDFSRASAVTGSFLIGLAILVILFWPLIEAYIANSKFQLSLKQIAKGVRDKQSTEDSDSSEVIEEPTGKASPSRFLIQKVSENKLISSIIILALVFGFYKVAAPRISLLNPITCSGLKKQLEEKDIQGRQIWNDYQSEVSRLGLIDSGISYEIWRNQVGNVQRRAVQLISNDLERYKVGYTKPHCVNFAVLNYLNTLGKKNLSILSGQTALDDGNYWNYDYGWGAGLYSTYLDSKVFLK